MEIRYASHPNEVKAFDTARLREEFLIEQLFAPDQLLFQYSHVDRFIIGGVVPVNESVKLEADPATIGAATFLERREIGIINVGGAGTVTVDGETYAMASKDCLYVGRGAKDSRPSQARMPPGRRSITLTPRPRTKRIRR